MSKEIQEALARVVYWNSARSKAEDSWLSFQGSPRKKEQLRRAYYFMDYMLLRWERRLDEARERARLRAAGMPLLRLASGESA